MDSDKRKKYKTEQDLKTGSSLKEKMWGIYLDINKDDLLTGVHTFLTVTVGRNILCMKSFCELETGCVERSEYYYTENYNIHLNS